MLKKTYCILSFFLFLFFSCDSALFDNASFNEPVKEYLVYWTESTHVGRYDVISSYKQINNIANLDATSSIRINLVLINPQQYNLYLLDDDDNPNFEIYEADGSTVTTTNKSAVLSEDKTIISLSAQLPDSTEKETLTLKGEFSIIKGEAGTEIQTVPYEYTFKQNTPPDDPKNLHNPTTADSNGYHCLHFSFPDNSLERNQNLTYFIECFDTDGNFKDSVTIEPSDIETANKVDGTTEFVYYFTSQTETLQYDYRVTFLNNHGLSVYCATSGNLGKCVANEPVITFGSNGTYNGQRNGDYDVIEYTGSSLPLSVAPKADNETVSVKINDEDSSLTTTLTDGNSYTIVATSTKNLAEPVTITKKVYAVKALTAPNIIFSNRYSDDGTNVIYRYFEDTKLRVNIFTPSNPSETTYDVSLTNTNGTILIDAKNVKSSYYDCSLEPGTYTYTATAKRTYCQEKTFTRSIVLNIRPIKVTFVSPGTFYCGHDDTGTSSEVSGNLYLQRNNENKVTFFTFYPSTPYNDTADNTISFTSVELEIINLTDTITVSSDDLMEIDDPPEPSDDDNLGKIDTEMSLSDLLNLSGTFHKKSNGADSEYFELTLSFTLSDNY